MSTPSDQNPHLNDPDQPPPMSTAPMPPAPPQYGPPQYAPPQYGPPQAGWPAYPPGYAPPPRTNGMAIAAMVLGIVWIYWIGSILALVFGYVARRQIRERGESGGGMATAGIVLGWVGVGTLGLLLVGGLISYLTS